MLTCLSATALASDTTAGKAGTAGSASQRPIYLDIVTDNADTVLDSALIEAMAREALSGAHRPVITLDARQAAEPMCVFCVS